MGGSALTYMYIYIYNHNCLGRSAQTFGSVQISSLPLIIFTMYTVILRQILHSTILSSCLPCISSLCSSQCVLPASKILHCSFKMSSNSLPFYLQSKQESAIPCSEPAAAVLCLFSVPHNVWAWCSATQLYPKSKWESAFPCSPAAAVLLCATQVPSQILHTITILSSCLLLPYLSTSRERPSLAQQQLLLCCALRHPSHSTLCRAPSA